MSLWKAINVMVEGNLIVHKDVAYAIIDERVCVCRYDIENNRIEHHHEVETSMRLMAQLFDTFVPHFGTNVFRRPSVPEFYVIEEGHLYDFSSVPEIHCPQCFTYCSRNTVYREGRYALCPGCNRRFWRASRYDGVREVVAPKTLEKKREKPEKPKPPTNEEIIESLMQDESRKVHRKIRF